MRTILPSLAHSWVTGSTKFQALTGRQIATSSTTSPVEHASISSSVADHRGVAIKVPLVARGAQMADHAQAEILGRAPAGRRTPRRTVPAPATRTKRVKRPRRRIAASADRQHHARRHDGDRTVATRSEAISSRLAFETRSMNRNTTIATPSTAPARTSATASTAQRVARADPIQALERHEDSSSQGRRRRRASRGWMPSRSQAAYQPVAVAGDRDEHEQHGRAEEIGGHEACAQRGRMATDHALLRWDSERAEV